MRGGDGWLVERRRGDDLVLTYRAAMLLRLLTSWDYVRVWRALCEVGFEASLDDVRRWLCCERPHLTPTVLEKSLYYHEAYRLVLAVAAEHPDWRHKKMAGYVSSLLPIGIPALTAYYWMKGLSRPNITPVKPCPALGYLVGVLIGDRKRTESGCGLAVKDREFAEYYARMYEKVTGVRLKVHSTEDGYYRTYERAAWLKELWCSGLWKVVAYAYPTEFLKGLYDSEGYIAPIVVDEEKRVSSVVIGLATGNAELKEFVKKRLAELGLSPRERYEAPRKRTLRGKTYTFGGSWKLRLVGWDKLERFAELIGFREGKRRRRLELLLRIRHLPPKERYKQWTKYYVKDPKRSLGRKSSKPPSRTTLGPTCQVGPTLRFLSLLTYSVNQK